MSNAILMESGGSDIDFMIHGLFPVNFFGNEVWITTSHVCILIVMLLMLTLAVVGHFKMKRATEVPDGLQNLLELLVEKLDGIVYSTMGKIAAPKYANYILTIFVFIFYAIDINKVPPDSSKPVATLTALWHPYAATVFFSILVKPM